jgi:hypothetical protein
VWAVRPEKPPDSDSIRIPKITDFESHLGLAGAAWNGMEGKWVVKGLLRDLLHAGPARMIPATGKPQVSPIFFGPVGWGDV